MDNIKLTISYDGSRYKGWQRLGDTDNTIQSKLENVIAKYLDHKIEIIGSGRTDAGVHAISQIANFKTNSTVNTDSLLNYCYHYLPNDIVVKKAKKVDDRFHARYNAIGKQYIYKIDNNPHHDLFQRKYRYHVPEHLNIDAMVDAATLFIGEKDFKSFTNMKSKKKSTVRTIKNIDITNNNGFIDITYDGNGFLYNMIRIITGTLIEVGLNKRTQQNIIDTFEQKTRSLAGPNIPPHGLFLSKVKY